MDSCTTHLCCERHSNGTNDPRNQYTGVTEPLVSILGCLCILSFVNRRFVRTTNKE